MRRRRWLRAWTRRTSWSKLRYAITDGKSHFAVYLLLYFGFAKVLAGGRGKGAFKNYGKGGVQLVFSADEAVTAAKGMIGEDRKCGLYFEFQSTVLFVLCQVINWSRSRPEKPEGSATRS
jgi:hypothetical protein